MRVRYLQIAVVVLFVVGVLAGSSYAKIDPETIVGIWLFDEGSGKEPEDSSKNENDGTFFGDPEWAEGEFGKALSFDGVDDYVNIPESSGLQPTEAFTLSAWVYPRNAPSSNNHMVIIALGSAAPRYYVDKNASNFHIRLQTTNDNLSYNVGSVEFDIWQHTAYTYDGENVRVYLNGALVDTHSASGDILTDTNDSRIADWPGGARHFNGLIDEVAVFNVALTEDDIKGIMTNGLGRATGITAVFPKGKLTTTWAGIKARD